MKQGNGHLKPLALFLILIFLAVLVSIERAALAQAISDKEKIETPPAAEALRQFTPGPTSSISEKNIFSPERKDFPLSGTGGKKPIVRPKIILYGVTIAGDYQAASIVNPGRPLYKGERETITLRMGEQISGYKLVTVLPDRVTLEAEGDSFEVLLYDPKMPKKSMGAKTEVKPVTVSSTQPVPAGPPPGITTSAMPKTSAEAPQPTTPRETFQGGVATPPPPNPVRPIIPSRRRMLYPPAGAPTQEPGGGN
jgi:hypothetical protein